MTKWMKIGVLVIASMLQACGGAAGVSGPPPEAPSAAKKVVPRAAAGEFRVAWIEQGAPFAKGVVISDEVAVMLSSRRLSSFDSSRGRRLDEREVCFTFSGALGWVGKGQLALVCETGIKQFEVKGLRFTGVRDLAKPARRAAFAAGLVAVVLEGEVVEVIRLEDGETSTSLTVEQPVTAIALSPDGGRLAIGLDTGEFLLRDLSSDDVQRVEVRRGFGVQALSFSADGKKLFASAGPVSAHWSLEKRPPARRRDHRVLGAVHAASWIADGGIATAGDQGLFAVDAAGDRNRSLGGGRLGSPVAIATSASGRAICAVERGGRLACLRRGGPTANTTAGLLERVASDKMSLGRVVGRHGRLIRVKAHPGAILPKVDSLVTVYRYVETLTGKITRAAWAQVVEGKVSKVAGDIIHVRVPASALATLNVKSSRGLEPLHYDVPVRLRWQ